MSGVERHRWRNKFRVLELANATLKASDLLLEHLGRTGTGAVGILAVGLPASADALAANRTTSIASLRRRQQ